MFFVCQQKNICNSSTAYLSGSKISLFYHHPNILLFLIIERKKKGGSETRKSLRLKWLSANLLQTCQYSEGNLKTIPAFTESG